MDVLNLIKDFVSNISAEYPSLHINYEYDSNEDEYIIWHNDSQLEYEDATFKSFVAKVARDIFFNNNIFNFSFGYDYFKSLELEKRTKTYNAIFPKKINVEYSLKTNNKVNDYEYIIGTEIKEQRLIGKLEANQLCSNTNSANEYSMLNVELHGETTVYNGSFFKEAA